MEILMRALVRFLFLALFLMGTQAHAGDARELAERLETKAMSGDIRAAYKLGLLFSQGKKVEPDYITAYEWFERAANQGYVKAMLKVAKMALEGQGTDPDIDRSTAWYEKAAQRNSTEAMMKLGSIFLSQNNFDEASFWYKKAAIKGNTDAMREMGHFYYKGNGVRFDLDHAFAWFELAAQEGDHASKRLLLEITSKKGQNWADTMKRRVSNRMIPKIYWDER